MRGLPGLRGALGAVFGLAIVAVAVSLVAELGTKPVPDELPNVILILSDQHRWHAMSFTETPEVHTPALERMAREGFRADNMLSNYPLCSPARAMVLTGRWPQQTGVIDNSMKTFSFLKQQEQTLGKVFSAAGYDTGYVGKWHLGGEERSLAPHGFEFSRVWTRTNDHWSSRYVDADGTRITSTRYNGYHMTDQFLEFVSRPRERPFFGVLSWNLPHSSYIDSPRDIRVRYARSKTPPWRENWSLPDDVDLESVGGGHYRGYHAHVTAIDGEIARIRRRLDELGIAEKTILVYLSDHGAMLRSHGLLGKRVPYAESVRVPFLVVWPGVVPAGGASDAPLGLIDVMPTICSLAGLLVPEGRAGIDFSQTILGREPAAARSQFVMNVAVEHRPEQPGAPAPLHRSVVTERYTYAVKPGEPWLLFDNQADPLQLHNLVGDPKFEPLQKELHGLLAEWIAKADDPFELPE